MSLRNSPSQEIPPVKGTLHKCPLLKPILNQINTGFEAFTVVKI